MRPFLTPLMDGIGLAHSHRGGWKWRRLPPKLLCTV